MNELRLCPVMLPPISRQVPFPCAEYNTQTIKHIKSQSRFPCLFPTESPRSNHMSPLYRRHPRMRAVAQDDPRIRAVAQDYLSMSRSNSPCCPSVLITETQTVQGIVAEDNLHVSLATVCTGVWVTSPRLTHVTYTRSEPTDKTCNRDNSNKGTTEQIQPTAM